MADGPAAKGPSRPLAVQGLKGKMAGGRRARSALAEGRKGKTVRRAGRAQVGLAV